MFAHDSSLGHTFKSEYIIERVKRKYVSLTISLKMAETMILPFLVIKTQKLVPNYVPPHCIEHLIKIVNNIAKYKYIYLYSIHLMLENMK